MKKILTLIIVLSIVSCGNSKTKKRAIIPDKSIVKGKVIEKVYCSGDSTQSYAIYVPKEYTEDKEWGIIYAFDSHAKGKLPVMKYKDLAEKYNLIIVGSNNSQNGTDPEVTNSYVKTMFDDTQSKLSIKKDEIYTLGFSGGARVASTVALNNGGVKGVIGCGAGFPQLTKPIEQKFNFAGLVGNEDFNMLELKNLDRQLNQTQLKHMLIVFDGKHEWPPVNIMNDAIAFVKTGISKIVTKNQNNDDQREKAEMVEQQKYLSSFSSKDLKWWQGETSRVFKIINTTKNIDEKLMQKRLMNFCSLIAYMNASGSIKAKRLQEAELYNEIYKMVDPTNSEHAYIAAQIYMLNGEDKKATESIKEAVKLGFDDFDRLKKDEILYKLNYK
ncbi:MAG: hypothetical protein Q8880_05465 [Bacteroidota bacterium]|nr:hypothetical protein [Bacteroidota bacterium]